MRLGARENRKDGNLWVWATGIYSLICISSKVGCLAVVKVERRRLKGEVGWIREVKELPGWSVGCIIHLDIGSILLNASFGMLEDEPDANVFDE